MNSGVGCHFLFQGIFPGIEPTPPALQVNSLPLVTWEAPPVLYSRSLLVIYFIHSSVYMSIPKCFFFFKISWFSAGKERFSSSLLACIFLVPNSFIYNTWSNPPTTPTYIQLLFIHCLKYFAMEWQHPWSSYTPQRLTGYFMAVLKSCHA